MVAELKLVLTGLVLATVLLTALFIHLLWANAARRNVADVVAQLNQEIIGQVKNEVRGVLFATLGVASAFALLAGLYLVRYLTRPVHALVSATRALQAGDVGHTVEPIQPGWVLTVEPGIYIPEEGFAVRLENDILVQENGYTDLMADIPIEADEIEDLMNRRR